VETYQVAALSAELSADSAVSEAASPLPATVNTQIEVRNGLGVLLNAAATRVETCPRFFLGLSAAIFLLATLAHSKRRFWFDELHTFYISRVPTLHDVWMVLMSGVDFNPPAIYLFTRMSHRILGTSPAATRLPEILLFLVMCFSIFVFVRRRTGVLFALGAMWFPLITVAYTFSAEARPHALVLGFCALAMVSWQRATEGGRRSLALALMSMSIAGFLMSHCYSVLILIAFGTAESVRFAVRRKPDWPLWACVIAPMSCGALYFPMLQHMQKFTMQSVIFKAGISFVPRFYAFLFNDPLNATERVIWHETVWPLLLVLLIAGFAKRQPASVNPPGKSGTPGIPVHEVVFLVTLSLLPVFGQGLASITSSPFNDRYALSAVIGISALLAFFVFRVTAGSQRAALAMVFIFSSWFVADFGTWFASLFESHPWSLPSIQLASLPKDTLIVISDPFMFLEAEYYEPPEVAERLRLLTEPETALRYTGTDMFDRGYYKAQEIFLLQGRIVDYSAFLGANRHFMAYGPFFDPEDWLFRKLLSSEEATVVMKGQSTYPSTHGQQCMLVEVTTTAPGKESSTE
jgi:hypothetical protein